MNEPERNVGYEDAEQILLGKEPAVDPTAGWSDEERARIAEIMKTVEPRAPVMELDIRKNFRKGQTIKDPHGLCLAIRSVGKAAMCVEVVGQKGRFSDGHQVKLGDLLFVTSESRKKSTVLKLLGQLKEIPDPEGDADGKAKTE